RELTQIQSLKLKHAGYSVVSQSMISLVPLNFQLPKQFDWIFFSSVNGVDYFLASASIPQNVKVAAVGTSTADHLEKRGFLVDFVGSGGDVEKVGTEFNNLAAKKIVLMPGSSKSTGKLQRSVSKNNDVIQIPVYDTVENSNKIESCLIYVFTSPANVRAFFGKNQKSQSKYLAIGKSTWEVLREF